TTNAILYCLSLHDALPILDTYFADPYKSIQRARNENTNGLIRQYLPKSSSFDDVSNEQTEQIEFALNHRPRKTLGWYTPSEVMRSEEHTSELQSRENLVCS